MMNKNLLAQAIDFTVLDKAFHSFGGFKFANRPISEIVNVLIPYVFVFAGLGLLAFLIMGGFQLMMSAGDSKAMESAKGKITNAVIGFIIVFLAYWITQLLEMILGLKSGMF